MSGFLVNKRGAFIEKDPDETLDYVLDMTEFLADGDTLKTNPLIVTATGLTVDSSSVNAAPISVPEREAIAPFKGVVIWLSGGVSGTMGLVHVRVETTLGRKKDVTFSVVLREK